MSEQLMIAGCDKTMRQPKDEAEAQEHERLRAAWQAEQYRRKEYRRREGEQIMWQRFSSEVTRRRALTHDELAAEDAQAEARERKFFAETVETLVEAAHEARMLMATAGRQAKRQLAELVDDIRREDEQIRERWCALAGVPLTDGNDE